MIKYLQLRETWQGILTVYSIPLHQFQGFERDMGKESNRIWAHFQGYSDSIRLGSWPEKTAERIERSLLTAIYEFESNTGSTPVLDLQQVIDGVSDDAE